MIAAWEILDETLASESAGAEADAFRLALRCDRCLMALCVVSASFRQGRLQELPPRPAPAAQACQRVTRCNRNTSSTTRGNLLQPDGGSTRG